MVDEHPPATYQLRPVSLTPEQKDLCDKLDALYGPYTELKTSAAEMFFGALIAIDRSDGNPDWVSQAANSLREIIYPLLGNRSEFKILRNQNPTYVKRAKNEKVGRMYGKLSKLTHHFSKISKSDFKNLLVEFEVTISYILPQQVDLHKDIDAFVSSGL